MIGTGALAGAMLFGAAATAMADPPPPPVPPPCTAAELARVMSGVTFDTSNYLTDHPDVNNFFTSLKGQPRDQISDQVTRYLDVNPGVRADLQGIRQPSVDFRQRCGAPAPTPGPLRRRGLWRKTVRSPAPVWMELLVHQQISSDRKCLRFWVGDHPLPVAWPRGGNGAVSVGSLPSFATRGVIMFRGRLSRKRSVIARTVPT